MSKPNRLILCAVHKNATNAGIWATFQLFVWHSANFFKVHKTTFQTLWLFQKWIKFHNYLQKVVSPIARKLFSSCLRAKKGDEVSSFFCGKNSFKKYYKISTVPSFDTLILSPALTAERMSFPSLSMAIMFEFSQFFANITPLAASESISSLNSNADGLIFI